MSDSPLIYNEDGVPQFHTDGSELRYPLRAACKHGRYDQLVVVARTAAHFDEPCLGGRDITINYEAVARKMYERSTGSFPPDWDEADQAFWFKEAHAAVVAAIGDGGGPTPRR